MTYLRDNLPPLLLYPQYMSWNNIIIDFQSIPLFNRVKTYILSLIRTKIITICGVHDPLWVRYVFHLKVNLRPQRNHISHHNFADTLLDKTLSDKTFPRTKSSLPSQNFVTFVRKHAKFYCLGKLFWITLFIGQNFSSDKISSPSQNFVNFFRQSFVRQGTPSEICEVYRGFYRFCASVF